MYFVEAFVQVSLYWALHDSLSLPLHIRHKLSGGLQEFLAALSTLSDSERQELKLAIVESSGRGLLSGPANASALCAFVDLRSLTGFEKQTVHSSQVTIERGFAGL